MLRLIVLGAGPDQVPLIRSARQKGCEVFAMDWNEQAPGRTEADHFLPVSIRDAQEVLRVAREIRPHGITTVASDVAVPTMSFVARELALPGNSLETAELVTNKDRMRAVLKRSGVPVPQVYDAGESLDANSVKYPVVVKPVDRSGSRGISLVRGPEDLEAALEAALEESFSGRVIAEEYVEGRQFDVQTVSFDGRHHVLSTIEEYYENAPHFIGRQHRVPSRLDAGLRGEMGRIACAALDALGVSNGACHCELRLGDDGIFRVLELGGRMGGDYWFWLVEQSTGHDYLGMTVDVALGRPPQLARDVQENAFVLRYVFEASDWDLLAELERVCPDRLRVSVPGPRPADGLEISSTFQKTGYFLADVSEPLDLEVRALFEPLDIL